MGNCRRSLRYVLLTVVFFPSIVHANAPIPAAAAFLTPAWLKVPGVSQWLTGLGMLLGVIAVEAAVLALVFRVRWKGAAYIAGVANPVTTGTGLLFASGSALMFWAVLGALGFIYYLLRRTLRWQAWWVAAGMLLAVLSTYWIMFTFPSALPAMVLQFYASMLYAILLTVLLESAIIGSMLKARFNSDATHENRDSSTGSRRPAFGISPWAALRGSLIANGISYGLILLILIAFGFRSGALASSEFLKHRIAVASRSGDGVGETLRKFEEVYLWQDTTAQDTPEWMREEVWLELQLVREWAEAGRMQDARDLFELVSRYRPRRNAQHHGTTYAWERAEQAIGLDGP